MLSFSPAFLITFTFLVSFGLEALDHSRLEVPESNSTNHCRGDIIGTELFSHRPNNTSVINPSPFPPFPLLPPQEAEMNRLRIYCCKFLVNVR